VKFLALPRGDWPLVVISGVLIALAYPPFHLLVPSFICLVPAVWLLVSGGTDVRPLRRQLVQGFWLGLVSNGLVLYWMVFALWRFTPLSALGYAATVVILAGYVAGVFALSGWVHRSTGASLLVLFPVFWTGAEWLIGHQGDIRFPWLGLGTSLTGFPTLVQVAELVGARGVTLLLVTANTALALAWLRRSDRRRALRLVGGVVLGVAVAATFGVWRERTLPLRAVGRITVLQPNVAFDEKRKAAALDSIVDGLLELSATAAARTRPDLMVWPEAAVPHFLSTHPQWERSIAMHARRAAVPIVVGGINYEPTAEGYEYYNAAFIFDSTGAWRPYPVYRKEYLVPITERVPFINPRWIHLAWFGGFGIGKGGAVYHVGPGSFGVLICYESAFEDLSRRYRTRGADFLVNITNDAWFGRTSAPYQHKAHLVMRAIENRVGIARAANSGISEFVDPIGRTHQETRLNVQTFATDVVETTDVLTLYTRFGDWVGTMSLALGVLLVGFAWWKRR